MRIIFRQKNDRIVANTIIFSSRKRYFQLQQPPPIKVKRFRTGGCLPDLNVAFGFTIYERILSQLKRFEIKTHPLTDV